MTLDPLGDRPPRYRRIRATTVPVAVYRRLYASERYGFLYESLEERGGRGRYSFLGGRPRLVFRSRGDRIEIDANGRRQELRGDPLDVLRKLIGQGNGALPVATFPGGAVGYLGYDVVRSFAPLASRPAADSDLPDAYFVFPSEVMIFDHTDEVVHLLDYGDGDEEGRADALEHAIRDAATEESPLAAEPADDRDEPPLRSNLTPEEFADRVRRAQAYIRAGDIYQVVLSQRFEFPVEVPPLLLYEALRVTNPSPYMYYLHLDGLHVSGSSPEVLAKLSGRRVVSRPLAGTRRRGETPERDEALAEELRRDEKERAEHVMLVDLARNDIGRVCRTGSVQVDDYLGIERYSRVMHLVSNVTGKLRQDRDAFDLFRSTFPAGTVSGAPKVRAMQIIDELEPDRRGLYAGAIGYFSFLGDMDLCIAIRTILVHRGTGYLQAGAGIVADSVPSLEYQETLSKARGLTGAIRLSGARGPRRPG